MSRMLVVEDDTDQAELLLLWLSNASYETTLARNASEALACLDGPAFDLALINLRMPGPIDGLDLVRRLRRQPRFARLPVFLVTASSWPEVRDEASAVGVDRVVCKPILEVGAVLAEIAAALREGRAGACRLHEDPPRRRL